MEGNKFYERTEIVEASMNLVQFWDPFLSQEKRKELAKRKADNVSQGGSFEEKKVIKDKKRLKKSITAKAAEMSRDCRIGFDSDSSGDEGSCEVQKNKYKPAIKSSKKGLFDSSDLSDADELTLQDKVCALQKENKKLKKELALYKTMKCISQEFPKLTAEFSKLTSRIEGLVHSRRGSASRHDSKNHESSSSCSSDKSYSSSSTSARSQMDYCLTAQPSKRNEVLREVTNVPTQSIMLQKVSPAGTFLRENSPPVVTAVMEAPLNPINDSDGAESTIQRDLNAFKGTKVEVTEDPLFDYCKQANSGVGNSDKDDFLVFGSKRFPREQVLKLRHNKLTILAGELVGLIFSSEELALCTLKGKKNNKYEDTLDKSRLDEGRVRSIIEYICKKKMVSGDQVMADINTAITNKLNNFKKTEEGKAIIARERFNRATQQTGNPQEVADRQQTAAVQQTTAPQQTPASTRTSALK